MSKGIVLLKADKTIQGKAKQFKLGVVVDAGLPLAFDKTLFTVPGTGVPWDLLPAAWHFLERWDAAVPMWRYGVNATDVGSKSERERTQKVVRDLRVLLHSVELLFVRDNADGQALIEAYREERGGGEARLAFLRALYRTKPRLCVLPRSWLAEVQQKGYVVPRAPKSGALVQVEIGPGQFVRCRPENVELVKERFAKLRGRRGRAR
jgi:hypothetical protein